MTTVKDTEGRGHHPTPKPDLRAHAIVAGSMLTTGITWAITQDAQLAIGLGAVVLTLRPRSTPPAGTVSDQAGSG